MGHNKPPVIKFVIQDKWGKITLESEKADWIETMRKLYPVGIDDRITPSLRKEIK